MDQREFTTANIENCIQCMKTIADALTRSKMLNLIGEINDLYLFLAGCKMKAKDENV